MNSCLTQLPRRRSRRSGHPRLAGAAARAVARAGDPAGPARLRRVVGRAHAAQAERCDNGRAGRGCRDAGHGMRVDLHLRLLYDDQRGNADCESHR